MKELTSCKLCKERTLPAKNLVKTYLRNETRDKRINYLMILKLHVKRDITIGIAKLHRTFAKHLGPKRERNW